MIRQSQQRCQGVRTMFSFELRARVTYRLALPTNLEASMATAGQLTKDQFGYSVPVDSPLYEPFPLEYEDVDILLYPYVTTAEAAAKLLPAQLTLAPVPGDTTGSLAGAQVVFARYGFSNVGSYNEVAQVI